METDGIGKIRDCVGCGFCCMQTPCGACLRIYPGAKICPALKWNGKRHYCDLMTLPGNLGAEYRKELYAGEGCCSNLNSWRREPLQDRTQKDETEEVIPKIFQVFLHCLGKEFISPDVLYLSIFAFLGELQKGGVPEEKAKAIARKIVYYLKGEQSKFNKDFMGSMDDLEIK